MNDEKKNLRHVIVKQSKNDKGKKGYFHTWGEFANEDGSDVMGVVELEDGSCDVFAVVHITFINKEKFITVRHRSIVNLIDLILHNSNIALSIDECIIDDIITYKSNNEILDNNKYMQVDLSEDLYTRLLQICIHIYEITVNMSNKKIKEEYNEIIRNKL